MTMFLEILKFTLIFLSLILIFGIVVLTIKSSRFKPKLKIAEAFNFQKTISSNSGRYREILEKRENIRKKWEKITEEIKSGSERDFRLAIIELDGLVDQILIAHGHPGEDMGERLKSIHPNELSNLNALWEAHKIRNLLAHEPDFHISANEAKKVTETYHQILEDLLSKELELV